MYNKGQQGDDLEPLHSGWKSIASEETEESWEVDQPSLSYPNTCPGQALGITFQLSVRLRCLHQDDKWEVNRNSNYLQTPAKVRTFTQTNYVTVQKEVRDSKLALVVMSELKEKRI